MLVQDSSSTPPRGSCSGRPELGIPWPAAAAQQVRSGRRGNLSAAGSADRHAPGPVARSRNRRLELHTHMLMGFHLHHLVRDERPCHAPSTRPQTTNRDPNRTPTRSYIYDFFSRREPWQSWDNAMRPWTVTNKTNYTKTENTLRFCTCRSVVPYIVLDPR